MEGRGKKSKRTDREEAREEDGGNGRTSKLGYAEFQELTHLLSDANVGIDGDARIADGNDLADPGEGNASNAGAEDAIDDDDDDIDEDDDIYDDDEAGEDGGADDEEDAIGEDGTGAGVDAAEDDGAAEDPLGGAMEGGEDGDDIEEDDNGGNGGDDDAEESTINAGVSLDLNVRALSQASFSTFLPMPHTIRILSEHPLKLGQPFPKGVSCLWDTYEVNDGRPVIQIITRRDDAHKYIETYGCFCSWECALAESETMGRDGNMRDSRKQWIIEFATACRGSPVPLRFIIPAPHRGVLKKYFGPLDIEIYRLFGAAGVVSRFVVPTQLQEYRFTNLAAMLAWAIDDHSANQTVATEKERKSLGAIVQRTLQNTTNNLREYGPKLEIKIPDQAIRDIMNREKAVAIYHLEQALPVAGRDEFTGRQNTAAANNTIASHPPTTTTDALLLNHVAPPSQIRPPEEAPRQPMYYPTTGTQINKMGVERPRSQSALPRHAKHKTTKLKKGVPEGMGRTANLLTKAKQAQPTPPSTGISEGVLVSATVGPIIGPASTNAIQNEGKNPDGSLAAFLH